VGIRCNTGGMMGKWLWNDGGIHYLNNATALFPALLSSFFSQ
jgi:hypothetical protein